MAELNLWDYGRNLPPSRWGELPGFKGGAFPSPIQLSRTSAKFTSLGPITPNYLNDRAVTASMKGFFFESMHFEIEIDEPLLGQAGGIIVGETFFPLQKLHFHTPAEHEIDGKPLSQMEVHLVHKPLDPSIVAIAVAIMVEELTPELQAIGETASPLIQFFRDKLPQITLPDAELRPAEFADKNSLNAGFPRTMSYFHYQGGLTTPPCSEPVLFYVLDTPIYATTDNIAKFASYIPGGNNRPTQQQNGRSVEYFPG